MILIPELKGALAGLRDTMLHGARVMTDPEVIQEAQAIADEANRFLRRDEVPDDELERFEVRLACLERRVCTCVVS